MNTSSLSRNRPPHLKERNCNYNCGYGCEKEKDGGAETDEETAVGDDVSSNAETQNEDSREYEDRAASRASLLSSRTAASDGTGLQLSSQDESESTSASMVVEHSSGNHTPVFPSGSARRLSPIPWIITTPVASPLPVRYYFLETPLRLSHEHEDCRGDPASHLVFPDRSRLLYRMEQLARDYRYAPAYRNVSPPSFGAC